jgi:hypothetical protein
MEERLAALEAQVAELDQDGFRTGVTEHVLDSIWAHLEQQGLAGFPERVVQDVADKVLSGLEERLAGIDLPGLAARLEALEARPTGSDAPGAAPGGAVEDLLDRVEALEERLAGVARSARETREELAKLTERPDASGPATARDAEPATAQPGQLEALEERLASLEQRAEEIAAAAAGGTEPAAADPGRVALESRLAALERRTEEVAAATDLDALSARLVEYAMMPVMKAIDGRLKKLDQGELSERVVEEAAKKTMRLVKGKLDEETDEPAPARQEAGGGSPEPGEGYDHKKFVALAREVMALKEASKRPDAAAGGAVALLNSTEFKQIFDKKINQVVGYLKSDVIPKAIKRADEGD